MSRGTEEADAETGHQDVENDSSLNGDSEKEDAESSDEVVD